MLKLFTVSAQCAACLLLALAAPARADFSYQQTSRITGGSMRKFLSMVGGRVTESVSATVSIKGDKMAYATPHMTAIIDLESKTVTTLNPDSKTYSVMTFDQINNAMETAPGPDGATITDFRVDLKDGTGIKTVLDKETHEKVITVFVTSTDSSRKSENTQLETHLYPSTELDGAAELKNFYKRMGGLEWSPALQGINNPEMNKALAALFVKAREIAGLPLLSVMALSGSFPGIPADMGELSESPSEAPPSGILSGKLGSLASAMQRRSQNAGASSSSAGPLLEVTSEVAAYSTRPVDPSVFEIPESFSKADPPTASR